MTNQPVRVLLVLTERGRILDEQLELPAVGSVLPLVHFHIDTALAQLASVLVLVDGELTRQPVEVRHRVRRPRPGVRVHYSSVRAGLATE
ncbi:MAG: hypothetical protein QM714_13025 [Nocardioides sp.]|uniref:hypothetical protein n=1 Tax=Nocardioides sp. TaxID=35761 RepID=UPI0039E27263